MLYKGKGDRDNPDPYCRIALGNNLFKIFTKILAHKLEEALTEHIPEHQFGFRKGRNTQQAIKCLIDDIETALRRPRGKYHAVFIDYKRFLI